MPRLSRKKKAGFLSWNTRQKRRLDSDPDEIRFIASTAEQDPEEDLQEIAQPETGIDESVSDYDATVSVIVSESLEDVTLPSAEYDERKSFSSEDFAIVDLSSVADSSVIEELPLPQFISLENTLESIFPNCSENFSILLENSDQCTSSCYESPDQDFHVGINLEILLQTDPVESPFASRWITDATLPSPILCGGEDEKTGQPALEASTVCSENSQIIDSLQDPDSLNEINRSATSETNHLVMPIPAVNESSIDYDCLAERNSSDKHADDQLHNNVIYKSTKKSTLNLSRSKTTIISIPGRPPGASSSLVMDCYCTACLNRAAQQQGPQVSEVKPKCVNYNDESTEAKMMDIYAELNFDQLHLSPDAESRTKSVETVDVKKRCQSRSRRFRCQATNGDEFTHIDLPKWKNLEGRRIIDYDYFVKWIVMAQAVHSRICCGVLCPRQEEVKSMCSKLWLMCNVCNYIVKGSSEEPSRGTRLRFCTDWAILNSGSTYSMANEMFSFLDLPFMDRKTFFKDELAMDTVLETALQESMDKAIAEEVDLATQEMLKKELPDDTPLHLRCELDGSWGQRSNGHRFSSASGCAAIIGTRSKKVVYIGTRNKRCSACNRNKSNNTTTEHKCFKNYSGASGGMESDIVNEGFKKMFEKGVKFTTVITDGDSTTVSKLKNTCPYGHEIKHQLCCNHALKNVGKKLREIKCPKPFTDHVSSRIERITKGARSAIKHCADTGSEDIEGLRCDIRNVPYHVFGVHTSCREYFCKHMDESSEIPSIITDLQKCDVWDKILIIMEKLASKAEFLCENQTSNLAENLFCRLCKYNVGKRVDTMSRGSYQRRVQITALMCNEGYTWHNHYMEMFTGQAPGVWTKKMFSEKVQALQRSRKAQSKPNYSRRSKNTQHEKEVDYGEEAVEAAENAAHEGVSEIIDVDLMRFSYQIQESTKQRLTNCLTITGMEELAKGRILSKFIPEIINAREATKPKKCELLMQTTNTWNHLKSNRAVVGLVLRVLKERHGLVFEENRMFIDPCHQFLCCVPDAVSEDNSMILLIRKKETTGDIKEQAATQRGVLGCKMKDGAISLDRNTITEIQAAIHICSSSQCLIFFMLGSNVSNHLFKIIDKDEDFFRSKVEKKVNVFFNDHFLKKLVKKQIVVKR